MRFRTPAPTEATARRTSATVTSHRPGPDRCRRMWTYVHTDNARASGGQTHVSMVIAWSEGARDTSAAPVDVIATAGTTAQGWG